MPDRAVKPLHESADERRLGEACAAVLESMHRYPIAATWGRDDLASSDMMSMETSKRVWQARLDPRRQTPSVGIYTHVRDRWGIFYAQPIVLNERQAGAAIEGVVRQEPLETAQLAVDTHGYTDFAMMLARLLGFDLCPRLKNLKQRRLYVPRGATIPEAIRPICVATADTRLIEAHWDRLVHLTASVHTGHTSAVGALARFGSASRGDPIYEAGAQLGRLLRTVFLTDYFVNDAFRRELLRAHGSIDSIGVYTAPDALAALRTLTANFVARASQPNMTNHQAADFLEYLAQDMATLIAPKPGGIRDENR